MNKISAVGRVVADAEVRFTKSGDQIASFRLASDVGFGDNKTTNWFSCQIWGKRAESLAPHLTKGSQLTVFGTLKLREWEDKEGQKKLSPDISVDELAFQGGKRDSENAHAQKPANSSKPAPKSSGFDDMESDIPF